MSRWSVNLNHFSCASLDFKRLTSTEYTYFHLEKEENNCSRALGNAEIREAGFMLARVSAKSLR